MEFATGALGTLLPKLGQLLLGEYNLQKGTKKNIEFLSRELESMRAALCSVGEVPPEQLKEHVRIWARDVRELSYDMEDIVDTFLVRVQGPEPPSKKSAKRFITKMMGIVTKATAQHEIAQEIKDIKERVKEVAERRDRYFIVIDDVWEAQTWETIKLALVENNSGSRIIITTRKHEVAKEAGEVYELQPLSDANSRKLFFARIFGAENKPSDHQMDDVSIKILRKCEGVPLAIITMASLLVGKRKEEWLEVHRSIGFGNKENRQVENTMKILSFSYYDLPSHLRTCLLHLSVFPEDYFIEKGPLIWMWIAEGFVLDKQGRSSFEIGEEYFDELVNRSMIQVVAWEEYDMVRGCHVHDMVMDLIRSISSDENFVTILANKNEGSSSKGRVRRLSLQNQNVEPHMDIQQVRSFIWCRYDIEKGISFSSFKLVRVLVIETCQSIERCHMEHLYNLLHLSGCPVRRVPDGIGKLRSLEELQIHYEYDDQAWRNFLKELGSLWKLRVLHVRMPQSRDARVQVAAVAESLGNLERMEHLSLTYLLSPVSTDTAMWEVAGFLLPEHLKRLFLHWISFSRFPSFCINHSRLPNLSHLSLYVDDLDEQDLRILGGFPQLCCLRLRVQSTMEVVVCNTTSTDGNGCLLFQKLRRCSIWSSEVRFKNYYSGSISFRIWHMDASILLGSGRMDDGKASIASNPMPSVQELSFTVHAREFRDGNCCLDSQLGLEYFASLQNVMIDIICDGASAAVVEEVAAALQCAADAHPNRPTLEMSRYKGGQRIIDAQEEEDLLLLALGYGGDDSASMPAAW
ncbi:hypothetical protein HU200_013139 [Digitaria exilis]|uniref:Uncharacterized protein n=1 Tax=Digitaria exilis TaxID=1010633 RepID=A0A835FDW1_9POAL|nr:hypothetical protein HU200_013139 [Digitaria exilis]